MVHWFPVFYDEFHQQPLFSPLCSQSLSLSLSVSDIIKPLILRSTFPKLASPCRYSILPAITHPIDWLLDPSLVIGIHVWIFFETSYTIILEDRILLTNLLLIIIYLRVLFRSRWDNSILRITIFPSHHPQFSTVPQLFPLVVARYYYFSSWSPRIIFGVAWNRSPRSFVSALTVGLKVTVACPTGGNSVLCTRATWW